MPSSGVSTTRRISFKVNAKWHGPHERRQKLLQKINTGPSWPERNTEDARSSVCRSRCPFSFLQPPAERLSSTRWVRLWEENALHFQVAHFSLFVGKALWHSAGSVLGIHTICLAVPGGVGVAVSATKMVRLLFCSRFIPIFFCYWAAVGGKDRLGWEQFYSCWLHPFVGKNDAYKYKFHCFWRRRATMHDSVGRISGKEIQNSLI